MALRIDARLGKFARQMRKEPTEPEKLLWGRLRNSQLEGFKFRRQTVIEPYICDFFCPARGLVVEVDGHTHDVAADSERDERLAQRGFAVLRFTNNDVTRNIDGVLNSILMKLHALPDRFTHPLTPPLKGRGGK